MMKLGYIDYLNCFPFYYKMFQNPLEGVEIVPGHPSDLNRGMREGLLDMSPISAAAYADIQDEVIILPDFCLASIGYVRSVILISRLPIEELDGKKIGLTTASQTSVALLKTLLKKSYGIEPLYEDAPPRPHLTEIDAALVIGNEAMLQDEEAIPYTYDLGDLWLRKTGFPVVFAVFAVRRASLEKYPDRIKAVINSYHDSFNCMFSEKQILVDAARAKYPDIAYDITTYYELIKYEFTGRLKKALGYYLKTAGEEGFVTPTHDIRFIPDDFSLSNI